MTLHVQFPPLARRNSRRQWIIINQVLTQLIEVGIEYTIIQVDSGGLIYLLK